MDPIVHFEIPSEDLTKAKEFYGSLFDWQLEDWTMPDGSIYVGARTTPVDETTRVPIKPGAINGGITKPTKNLKAPSFSIHVTSIDAKVIEIENAGGKILMPKTDVMGMGFMAYFSDLDGNVMSLWEDAKKA